MLNTLLWTVWAVSTLVAGVCTWGAYWTACERMTPPPGYERAWITHSVLLPYGAIYSCELRGDVVDSVIRAAMIDTIWHGPVWKQVQ